MVCEVGNLYGAPSAGNAWWNKVKSINKAFPGLVQSEADPSCFILTRNSTKLIVVIYVDDFGIFHSGTTAGKALAHEYIEHFNKHVGKPLKVHEGKVHEFLGLTITKTQTGFKLSASKYIDMLRARFFPSGVTHAGYKVPADKDLPSIVISAAEKKTAPDPQLLQRCQCLIGSLMFATNARPDIQYTVSQLARCMAWPDANIEAAAERCLIYLIGTQDLGLHYERVADPKLFGCSDANWCTRQSTSGCAFKIGTAIISYFSKKQGHISLSTFEAEISAGTLAACEAVHLRSLLSSLGYKPKGPTIIKIDKHGRAARRRGPGHARQDEAHPAQGAQDSRARRVRGGQGRVRREPQELRRLLHQAAPAQGVRVVPQGDHERHRLGRHRGETPTSPSSNVVDNRQYGRSWSSPSHLYIRPPPLRRLRNCARDSRRCRSRLASSDPQPRYPMRGWGAVEDRRPRSRLVDGHTHTHSVLTTQGLHLRSFVPLRRGFAKTVLQRRGFALHLQP